MKIFRSPKTVGESRRASDARQEDGVRVHMRVRDLPSSWSDIPRSSDRKRSKRKAWR
jgi:hypothetical protein